MSQAEFDAYLSLMAKFLRLRSRQRDDLADELRDHLDSRLDELLAQGKSREQAVKIALEEFGDAAVLAEDFSRLASRHTRRFVMRCTAASAVVVAAVVLLTLSLAPPVPDGPGPQNVVAQEEAEAPQPAEIAVPAIPNGPSVEQQAVAALDEKLDKRLTDVAFVEMPLENVLSVIADQIEADVLVDKPGLEDEGVVGDTPVSLSLTRTPVTARTVLAFVLDPNDLTFVNRAGVIYVTTVARADELLTTKVYNVRDLLENAKSLTTSTPGTGMGGMGGGMGGGGFYSIPTAALLASNVGQLGGMEGEGGAEGMMEGGTGGFGMGSGGMGMGGIAGGMGGYGMESTLIGPANELISTIQQTTSGQWIDVDGVGGTLTVFNGLLVVRQTEPVHIEIQKLLDALREAAGQQPGSSVTVPKKGEARLPGDSFDDPAGALSSQPEHLDWPDIGLKMKVVVYPTGIRLRILEVSGHAAAAGLEAGQFIISWSVDKWTRIANDDRTMAFNGQSVPNRAELDLSLARAHGATAMIFEVVSTPVDGRPEVKKVKVPIEDTSTQESPTASPKAGEPQS